MGLIFSLFRHRFSLRHAFWHTAVCGMHSLWTYQCLVAAYDGFLCITEIIRIHIADREGKWILQFQMINGIYTVYFSK